MLLSFGFSSLMFVNSVMKCSAPSLEPHSSFPIDRCERNSSEHCGSVGDFIPLHAVTRAGMEGFLRALETLPLNFCKGSGCLISAGQRFVRPLISFVTLILLSTSCHISFMQTPTPQGGDASASLFSITFNLGFCAVGGGQVCVCMWRLQ